MQLYALVDYDNVKLVKDDSEQDVEFNVNQIADKIVDLAKDYYGACREIYVRFYGGWTDKANSPTKSGRWIRLALGRVRGRRRGTRVLPALATGVLHSDESLPPFIGLYRDGGQKMVDTLLVVDLVGIAREHECPIILLSSDEDMLPGIVAVSALKRSLVVARSTELGKGMNDVIYKSLNVRIAGAH